MTNKYCDSPTHKCLCLSLALIFFFSIVFSIPAGAVDPSPSPSSSPIRPNEPIGWKDGDTFRDIMLVVLDSWGISFSKSDPDDEKSILEYSDELMQQFYDANHTTQELFWDLVQYGASETGDIILDFLGVNKIRQFANWLIDKFSLQDNSSVSTGLPSGYYLIDGTPVNIYLNDGYVNQPSFSSGVLYTLTNGTSFILVSDFSSGQAYFNLYKGNTLVYSESQYTGSNPYLRYWFTIVSGTNNLFLQFPSQRKSLSPYTVDTFFGNMTSFPSLVINTQIINVPSEDLNPDDGLQIEVPGTNWGDSIFTILNIIERLIGLYDSTQLNINSVIELISTLLQGLQKSVSVENIPGAVVLDYDEYDIPLETEWSLVEGFFSEETEGSPFSTLTTILYAFPEPFVLFFSVIVVFVVAYGFIRLGRDSH